MKNVAKSVNSVKEKIIQKRSLDGARDEIERLQNLLEETNADKKEVETSLEGKEKELSEARDEIARQETKLQENLT